MNHSYTTPDCVAEDVRRALEEDIRTGDLTALMIEETQQAHGRIIAREPAILCGQPWFNEAFHQVDPNVKMMGQVVGGIIIDTQYRSQPKKTLAQAKSDFEKVNSRESFVKAMKDNEEFMQNAEILSTCKDLATKYPKPETQKV